MRFKLPDLKYDYNALEPHIDSKTMEIHHGKHHNGYTNNLNTLLENSGKEEMTIEELLKSPGLSDGLKNNGGGYYNHCLFWDIMSPNGGGEPNGILKDAIDKSFGSFAKTEPDIRNRIVVIFLNIGFYTFFRSFHNFN